MTYGEKRKKEVASRMKETKGYYRLTNCTKCGQRMEDKNYKLHGVTKCTSCGNKEK